MKKLFFILFFGALLIGANAQYWNLTGNSNTTSSHFIGTSDCQPLIFKTRGLERMRLEKNGIAFGIGTTAPQAMLHVHNPNMMDAACDDMISSTSSNFKLLQLTSNSATNGFTVSYKNSKDILFKHSEQGKLYLEGLGGGLTIAPDGNIGVGTDIPDARLDVDGSLKATSANITGTLTAQTANISGALTANALTAQNANIPTLTTNAFTTLNASITNWLIAHIAKVGNLQINVDSPSDKVFVINYNQEVFSVQGNGALRTKEIFTEKVEVKANAWADHVFNADYNLRPLSDLEQYINQNYRLPEIPSAQEVEENGINLGDMQSKLLLKIEELTLYILQQEKKMADLQNQINELKNQ